MTETPVAGLVVVLGGTNAPDGKLSAMSERRLTLGLARFTSKPKAEWKILLTGGYGTHFNIGPMPHAHYAQNWLFRHGLDANDFVAHALSKHTIDDGIKAREIITALGVTQIEVVTSDFHIPRVEFVFRHLLPDLTLSFFGSPCIEHEFLEVRKRILGHEASRLASMRTESGKGELFTEGSRASRH